MRFKLQYDSKIKQIGYKFAHFWSFSLFFMIPFGIVLFVAFFSLMILLIKLQSAGVHLFIIGELNDDTAKPIFWIMFVIGLILVYYIIWRTSIFYVELTPKGVFIHHGNFMHFGLHQFLRINVNVPYNRIVSCKIGIPVDCPRNYRYTRYNQLFMIIRYFDLKHGREVEYMKEPALAGGRYDEKCILLELDNKRIIVIPIDECEKFLELFNQYIEKYNELQKTKEKEN